MTRRKDKRTATPSAAKSDTVGFTPINRRDSPERTSESTTPSPAPTTMPSKGTKPRKRPAPASTEQDQHASKKQKVDEGGDKNQESDTEVDPNPQAVRDVSTAPEDTTKAVDKNTVQVKARPKKAPRGRLPVKSLFTPWKPNIDVPKVADTYWGTKPIASCLEPDPHPGQPPAKTSNAQTIPPLWEDRGYKFIPGRYHKKFGPMADEVDMPDDAPDLDQEDNLTLKLIDMRPISKHNREPRRKPVIYAYENGKPKDWEDEQTLKALNDRRREAITRITCDPPWTEMERHYLAELVNDFPNGSLVDWTMRFNYRFQGDFKETTAFGFNNFHDLRTLESVRHEYLQYKELYDEGFYPEPLRPEGDKTGVKKEGNRKVISEADRVMAKFDKPIRTRAAKKDEAEVIDSDAEEDHEQGPEKPVNTDTEAEQQPEPEQSIKVAQEPRALPYADLREEDIDEAILDLAGYYHPEELRSTSPLPAAEKAAILKHHGLDADVAQNGSQPIQESRQPSKSRSASPSSGLSKSRRGSKSPEPSESRRASNSYRVSKSPPRSKSPRASSPKLIEAIEKELSNSGEPNDLNGDEEQKSRASEEAEPQTVQESPQNSKSRKESPSPSGSQSRRRSKTSESLKSRRASTSSRVSKSRSRSASPRAVSPKRVAAIEKALSDSGDHKNLNGVQESKKRKATKDATSTASRSTPAPSLLRKFHRVSKSTSCFSPPKLTATEKELPDSMDIDNVSEEDDVEMEL